MVKKEYYIPIIVIMLILLTLLVFSFFNLDISILITAVLFVIVIGIFAFLKGVGSFFASSIVAKLPNVTLFPETIPIRERKKYEMLRVVRNPQTGKEIVIGGNRDTTYRAAMIRNWDFVKIAKDSPWILRDEIGNDITDSNLEDYDGIVTIEHLDIPQHGYRDDSTD
ncbi:MAG: hypothetical protein BAJATHORv1_60084 [Candidatus Thorarchaeota archaeon]|nr:MAG: hypothetical protein BAJATHORv1_60084 [Candidatus Thorarchaeota archaeon]